MARELVLRILADNTDAKAKLSETEQHIGGLDKSAAKTEASWRKVGAAIGGAFSLSQFAGMARDIANATGKIDDLSLKLGIGREAVQEFQFIAGQFGGTIEQIGTAISMMGSKLTDGDKGTVAALGALGLSIEHIRAMTPDRAFQAIGAAIAQVEDPMKRSQVAMDLFGRSGAQLLPVLTSDMEGLRVKARETGLVITDDLIKRGDQLGDSWEEMSRRVAGVKAQALLPVFELFVDLPRPIQTTIGIAQEFSGVLTGLGLAVMAAGGPVAAFSAIGSALTVVGGAIAAFITGPIALIIAAVVGLGIVWFKWGDDITRIVKETFASVKTWLWDKLEPVLTPIIKLLGAVGDMFTAFGMLVFAVGMKVAGNVADLYGEIKAYLWDKLRPVIEPALLLIQKIQTVFKAMADAVIRIVTDLYTGIRTYLLDRFTAVVDGVRQKVEAVTGFFRNMYQQVVGNSWVPDMVTQIGGWFQKLDGLMVSPARTAADSVSHAFSGMASSVMTQLGNLISGTAVSFEAIKTAAWDFASSTVASVVDILVPGLGQIITLAWPVIQAGLEKLWGLFKGFFDKIWEGLKAIGGFFKRIFGGGEEAGGGPTPEETREPGSRGPGVPRPSLPTFAHGSGGRFLDFGSGTLAMLHGREMIVPESDVRAAPSGGFGGPSISITVDAAGAFFPDRQSLSDLTDMILRRLPAASAVYVSR